MAKHDKPWLALESYRGDGVEVREYELVDVEVREDDDKRPTLRGYAAVFDKLSLDLGGFREKIQSGAFAKTLKDGGDVPALWNHNSDKPLARTSNGSLKLAEDQRGLRVEMTPTEASWGKDAVIAIRERNVNKMSFAFRTVQDRIDRSEKEKQPDIRTLLEVRLLDVSPVTRPAYPQTGIAARSLEQLIQRLRSGETLTAEERDAIERLQTLNHQSDGPAAEGHPTNDEGREDGYPAGLASAVLELAARS